MFDDLFQAGSKKLNLRLFKWFLEAASTENIAQAAGKQIPKLNPSVLSRGIAQLEAELEMDLIERTSHGIRLTDAGEQVQRLAREMFVQLREVRAKKGAGLRKIYFVAGGATIHWLLLPHGEQMSQVFRDASFCFRHGSSYQVVEQVSREAADFGIAKSSSIPSTLQLRSLGHVGYVGVVASNEAKPINLDEERRLFERLPLVTLSGRGEFRRHLEDELETRQIRVAKIVECQDFREVVSAVRHFRGIGFVPQSHLIKLEVPGDFKLLDLVLLKGFSRDISLTWNSSRLKARRISDSEINQLFDLLRSGFPEDDFPKI